MLASNDVPSPAYQARRPDAADNKIDQHVVLASRALVESSTRQLGRRPKTFTGAHQARCTDEILESTAIMPNCLPPSSLPSTLVDARALFAARHLPLGTRVFHVQQPFLTGTVCAADGLERTVELDPLMEDSETLTIPSWLPHTSNSFGPDLALRKSMPVHLLRQG
jgi:hypothetical protein